MIARIGKYEIREERARGGFGRILRAWDSGVGRDVAIKVLAVQPDEQVLTRFHAEASTTAKLNGHKNIVTVYDYGEHDGSPYLVMEYLDGRDLGTLLAAEGGALAIPLVERVRIMVEAAEGLRFAHAQGVIHRDIKPANLMLLPDGRVKVMDFGIARLVGVAARLTGAGSVLGTLPYMAPEQFDGVDADAKTDIFSYGVVFYELLTGAHPFGPGGSAGVVSRIRGTEPRPVRAMIPDCPPDLEALVMRALAKDRPRRYDNFGELLLDAGPVLVDLVDQRAAELLAAAEAAVEAGGLEEGRKIVLSVLHMAPSSRRAHGLRRDIEAQLRERARKARIQTLLRAADERARERRFEEAVRALEAAGRLDAADSEVAARLAEVKAALEAASAAASRFASATSLAQAGKLDEALAKVRDALEADPDHRDAAALEKQLLSRIEVRDREARLRSALETAADLDRAGERANIDAIIASIRRVIAAGDLDAAERALSSGRAGYSGEIGWDELAAEIVRLREAAEAARAAAERESAVRAGLESAERKAAAGDLAGASALLDALARAHPGDTRAAAAVDGMRRRMEDAIAAPTVAKVEELHRSRQWVVAYREVAAAARKHPTNARLITARIQAESAVKRAVTEHLCAIVAALVSREWNAAHAAVRTAMLELPGHLEFDRFWNAMPEVREAWAFEDAGHWSRAEAAWSAVRIACPEYPDIAAKVEAIRARLADGASPPRAVARSRVMAATAAGAAVVAVFAGAALYLRPRPAARPSTQVQPAALTATPPAAVPGPAPVVFPRLRVAATFPSGDVLVDGHKAGALADGEFTLHRLPAGRHAIAITAPEGTAVIGLDVARDGTVRIAAPVRVKRIRAVVLAPRNRDVTVAASGRESVAIGARVLRLAGATTVGLVGPGTHPVTLGDGDTAPRFSYVRDGSPSVAVFLAAEPRTIRTDLDGAAGRENRPPPR